MTITERQEAKESNAQSLSGSRYAGFVSTAMSGSVGVTQLRTESRRNQPEWITAAKQTELFAGDEGRSSFRVCAAARTGRRPRARVALPAQPEVSEDVLDAADRLFGHLAKAAGLARDTRRESIAMAFDAHLLERRQRERGREAAASATALIEALLPRA